MDYTIFEHRLDTFINWPNTQVPYKSLAAAGFIYTGENATVICPFCKLTGLLWVYGDNPMKNHILWEPNCPFIRRSMKHDHSEDSSRNLDTCDLYCINNLPNSVPKDSTLDLKRLGIHENKGPVYKDKISYESRLATFKNWPKSVKQRPRPTDLAEAGFYYSGIGDETWCFYCGGSLKDWLENDEPWDKHALWFNECVYLSSIKGAQFIAEVKQNRDRQLSLPSTSNAATKEEPRPKALSESCEKPNPKETVEAEKTLCKICYKNEVGVVFLPCGHIIACVDCAAALKTCAVCRHPLEATVRAFLS